VSLHALLPGCCYYFYTIHCGMLVDCGVKNCMLRCYISWRVYDLPCLVGVLSSLLAAATFTHVADAGMYKQCTGREYALSLIHQFIPLPKQVQTLCRVFRSRYGVYCALLQLHGDLTSF
jgi:hypothetical protein